MAVRVGIIWSWITFAPFLAWRILSFALAYSKSWSCAQMCKAMLSGMMFCMVVKVGMICGWITFALFLTWCRLSFALAYSKSWCCAWLYKAMLRGVIYCVVVKAGMELGWITFAPFLAWLRLSFALAYSKSWSCAWLYKAVQGYTKQSGVLRGGKGWHGVRLDNFCLLLGWCGYFFCYSDPLFLMLDRALLLLLGHHYFKNEADPFIILECRIIGEFKLD